MYTEDAQKSEKKAQEAKAKIKDFMKEYSVAEDETLDQIEYDCLVRLCNPYKSSIPGENQPLLDAIVAYDATHHNKSIVVKEFRIWELADKYQVVFEDDEKEEIVSTFIEREKNTKVLDDQKILQKAITIMDGLGLKSSKACNAFEYAIINEFASVYDKLPIGKAEDIVAQIKACHISDKVKKQYVYDKDIWELFEYYNIEIKKEEHIDILYRQYAKLISQNEDITEEEIKKKLYPIVAAIVDTEENTTAIYKPKADIYLKTQIAKSIRKHLIKAEIHGHLETTYTEIGLFFNSDHKRVETLWVYGDPGFEDLWNELLAQLPEESNYAEDILLIYTYRIDDKKRMYTFLTHESIYGKQEGGSVTCAPIYTYDYLSQYGHVNLKNGKTLIDAFSVKGRSDPECNQIVEVMNKIISSINKQVASKKTRVGQLKAYYEQAKKVVRGESPLDSLDNYSLNSMGVKINTVHNVCATITSAVSGQATVTVDRKSEALATKTIIPTQANPRTIETKTALESCVALIDKTKPLNHQLATLLAIYGNVVAVRTFLPGTAAFEKKIGKAVAAYAPISSGETPLLMEDFTIFGSAKEGFVWTNQKVYIKDTLEPKVVFSIQDVNEVRYAEKGNSLC